MQLLYWMILCVVIILLLYFLDIKVIIKTRKSAIERAKQITVALLKIVCAFAVIFPIVYALFWINSNLGTAIFVLIFLYILWAIFALLMKYKEKLLAKLLGVYLFTKLKAFLAGMSLFIKTPIGLVTISFGSITWIGVSSSYFNNIIYIEKPVYIWTIAGVILSWGITSMVESLINTIKSIFFRGAKPDPKAIERYFQRAPPLVKSEVQRVPQVENQVGESHQDGRETKGRKD
jgi:hypothetical protein